MKSRPAESASGAGALALLISYVAGVKDPEALLALGVGLGLIPAAVTLLVVNGGLRGVGRLFWRGR